MSAAPCFYHPDQVASTTCAQCAVPLCGSCVETVANKSVCRRCVSAIRARVATQMNGPTNAAPPAYQVSANAAKASSASVGTDAGRLALGILAAVVVGVVGSVIWEKIYFNLHFGLSLIYLGIGAGVAWALVQVSGSHTGMTAPLAALITLITLMVGHLALAYDITGEMSWTSLMFVCSHLGPMHWICVALGLFGAFRTIERGG